MTFYTTPADPMIMHNRTIRKYYDTCEGDYSVFMDLNKNLSMHFGYWDSEVKTFSEAMQRINSIMADIAGIKKEHVVLDAGCGVGGSAIFLTLKIGCTVYGITVSERQASRAGKYALERTPCGSPYFITADFTQTPFKQHTFDVVWAIESACHAHDKRKFIAESSRLLKNKGILVIADAFATKADPS